MTRRFCVVLILLCFFASRVLYWVMGLRFDAAPADFYWQIMDPVLLRHSFWQSLFYLRAQMPGFNLLIGALQAAAPGHEVTAFYAVYLCMGLILALCLFDLLDRMGVNRYVALAIVVAATVSPVTALYESWLFYEYPLAVLFAVSALLLHRYAAGQRRVDGVLFFAALAAIGLLRVVFHLVWFWAIVAVLVYALPRWRRRTVLCAAAPGLLLTAVYVKSLLLFGTFAPGADVFGGVNLASMMSPSVPPAALQQEIAAGRVSPLMRDYDGYSFERPELVNLIPLPPSTGIPILDERLKSTGKVNMDGLWMAAMGAQLHRDGMALLARFPGAYLKTVAANLDRYFAPADVGWPFDGRTETSRRKLLVPLRITKVLLSGWRNFTNIAVTLVLLYFGARRMIEWLRGPVGEPGGLTTAFLLVNIVYLSAVVILYSNGDQNRYRFEISPLFTALFGLWAGAVLNKFRTANA